MLPPLPELLNAPVIAADPTAATAAISAIAILIFILRESAIESLPTPNDYGRWRTILASTFSGAGHVD